MSSGDRYGWGEAAPWRDPAYSPESAAGVMLHLRKFLVPLVIGRSVSGGKELQEYMRPVKGNQFAKAALDLAYWDLLSRSHRQPLWRLLGGTREIVEVGADIGVLDSFDDLKQEIEAAFSKGFLRIKLKYRPGWDLDMVRFVRGHFPRGRFHVDCNSAYRLEDISMFRKLDDCGLEMIEQPLQHDDLIDHAALQKELKTALCLDESITSLQTARQAVGIGSCRWINIKPGRVGGLTPAVQIHDFCMSSGIPCWVGGMLESSVGAHHCLALASLQNFVYPADIFPSSRFYQEDAAEPAMTLSCPSRMTMSELPGCGAEPVPERMECFILDSFSVGEGKQS